MPTLLLKNADLFATMDDSNTEIPGGGLFARDGVIEQVGLSDALPATADTVIDARGMLIIPGMVNTHHHFCQTLTRAIPAAQDAGLFDWLKALYPIWAGITPEAVYISAKVAIAELICSGCTTSSDHTYLWPNGARLDDQIQAAQELGLRFHAARGSMSVGESQGGLPPDQVVEREDAVLRDSRRLVETYHDPKPHAMLRIVLAPCSPFSVSPELMRESVALARSYGVHSHTHLAETRDEADYCQATFGRTPVELAEELGWVGADVWHAHMVHPSGAEVLRLGRTATGVAHCPTSNMRLASGVAPLRALQRAGARVGLGVDGSASNDGSHMLAEARQAMLLHRLAASIGVGEPGGEAGEHIGSPLLTAREALRLATRGGAAVLGRDDIGALAPGMACDVIGYRLDTLGFAGGAIHDPLAALVFCQPPDVTLSIIGGRVRVAEGELLGVDLRALVARHNQISRALARKE
jgi:cytosine/adenosine deaminase-related metal-dependent hydrolase